MQVRRRDGGKRIVEDCRYDDTTEDRAETPASTPPPATAARTGLEVADGINTTVFDSMFGHKAATFGSTFDAEGGRADPYTWAQRLRDIPNEDALHVSVQPPVCGAVLSAWTPRSGACCSGRRTPAHGGCDLPCTKGRQETDTAAGSPTDPSLPCLLCTPSTCRSWPPWATWTAPPSAAAAAATSSSLPTAAQRKNAANRWARRSPTGAAEPAEVGPLLRPGTLLLLAPQVRGSDVTPLLHSFEWPPNFREDPPQRGTPTKHNLHASMSRVARDVSLILALLQLGSGNLFFHHFHCTFCIPVLCALRACFSAAAPPACLLYHPLLL